MQQTNRDRRLIDVILKDIDTLNQRVKHMRLTKTRLRMTSRFKGRWHSTLS